MLHLLEFNFFHKNKSVVSFDFDGVLHTSTVGDTIHPINLIYPLTWKPNLPMFKILEKEKENNRVIIVTSRPPWNKPEIEEFLKLYNIKVDDIIMTNDIPKREFLVTNKVIRHYDDNIELKKELVGTGIQLIVIKHGKPIELIAL